MVSINAELCIGCGSCAADCCSSNIRITGGKAAVIRACIECGHCAAVCPVDAVSIPGLDMRECEKTDPSRLPKPEDLIFCIRSARSVRRFTAEKPSDEVLLHLAEAGRYTATAKNAQENRFVFVRDGLDELKKLTWSYLDTLLPQKAADADRLQLLLMSFRRQHRRDPQNDYFFRNAPTVLYIGSRSALDAGLAAKNIENMAQALGLGVMHDGFLRRLTEQNPEARKFLGLEDREIGDCMLLGYPAVSYVRTAPRKPADIIIR